MAHLKSRSKNVVTGEVTETFYTDEEWAVKEQARLDAEAVEAARDHDEEAVERVERVLKAFLKAYAAREGLTWNQVKNAIKAEL